MACTGMDSGSPPVLQADVNQAFGGLTTENGEQPLPLNDVYYLVLEYFATSPFYDRQSNNQVLKMQSQFNALGDLNQRLSSMRGIEFTVHSEHPPEMWIIRKQRRQSPEDGSVCVLNIVDGQWCRWHITLW
jgi:hypothetical protein